MRRVPAKGALAAPDAELLDAAYALLGEVRPHMDGQQISRALDAIWKVVADANRYFAGQEPWALKKTDPARMETVLWTTAETIRVVGILAQFVMPQSAAKLLDLLSVPPHARGFRPAHRRAWPRSRNGTSSTQRRIPALRGG